jgi:anti-sigma-K factor RskA
MPYDVNHALEHPDVAGWALGALDGEDSQAFEEHLRSCDDCRAAVAEFEAVAEALKHPAPAIEPAADLQARTVAAVQYAAKAAKRPEKSPDKASHWWRLHWTGRFLPLLTAVAAAAVTAGAFLGGQIFQAATPAVAASYHLAARPGQVGSATGVAREVHGGYEVQLTVKDLPKLRPGQFYECWYAGPDNRAGHQQLVSGGTFSSSNGAVTMLTAANLGEFRVMEITVEQAGAGNQQGTVIASGSAQDVHDDD